MEQNISLQIGDTSFLRSKRLRFYLEISLLYAIIFVRNILEISIPVGLILVYSFIIALGSRRDEIFALSICCIPLWAAFQYKYLLLFCILIYAMKYPKDIRISYRILPLLLMMAWELLHGGRYSFSYYEYLRDFSELIFCSFLLTMDHKKTDYPMISRLLAVSSVFVCSVVLINLLKANAFDFLLIFRGSYRFGVGNSAVQNFGLNYNANQLGFICNLSVSGLIQLILSRRQRKADYFLITALILFGVMTMSRTFLVCLALLFVLFVCFGNAGTSAKIKRIFAASLVLLLITLAGWLIMPTVFNSFAARFLEEDISNGRLELFLFYHEHLMSGFRPMFFGTGIQHYTRDLVNTYNYLSNVSHNGVQEIVLCWGIPGLLLMASLLCSMISHRKREFRRRNINYIPLILLMVDMQAGQFLRSGVAMLALSFVCLSLQYDFIDSTEDPANENDS